MSKRQRGDDDVVQSPIVRLLRRTHRSDTIDLRGCKLSDNDCAAVADEITHSSYFAVPLASVRLCVAATDRGVACVLNALAVKSHKLRLLDVSGNVITDGIHDALRRLCDNAPNLEVVNVCNTRVTERCVVPLLDGLVRQERFGALLCNGCEVGPSGGAQIAKILGQSRALHSDHAVLVALNRNRLGSSGLRALQVALPGGVSVTATRQRC